jgi:hypothetical protein
MHSVKFKLDSVIYIVALSNLAYGAFGKKHLNIPIRFAFSLYPLSTREQLNGLP